MVFRVLVVCEGNYCRSPLAERLLAHRLSALGASGFSVASAGTRAVVGHGMEPTAERELVRLGGSATGFVARQLTEGMVRDADLVLTATRAIRARTLEETPSALRRTFTLRELSAVAAAVLGGGAGSSSSSYSSSSDGVGSPAALVAEAARVRAGVPVEDYDLDDPIGQDAATHRRVADEIDLAVSEIARALSAVQ